MAALTADFEAGTNGNTITTGAGEGSTDPFSYVNGSPTYSDTHVAHGTLAGKFVAEADRVGWSSSDVTDHYGRFYIYCPSAPSAGNYPTIARFYDGGTKAADIFLDAVTNKVYLRNSAGTWTLSTNALVTGAWGRIEYHIVHSATVGQITARIYNTADSSSATEEYSTPASYNTLTKANSHAFGCVQGTAPNYWFDNIVANATDWVGPVAVPAQKAYASSDSVDGAWTDQTGGTSLYAAISETAYSDTDYIKSEATPSNSGCRVKLGSLNDPVSSSDHIIRWRPGKDTTGGDTINMTVKLYEGGGNSQGGGTLIASFARNDVDAFTTYEETLSSGEADSITNYADLYLEFFANKV